MCKSKGRSIISSKTQALGIISSEIFCYIVWKSLSVLLIFKKYESKCNYNYTKVFIIIYSQIYQFNRSYNEKVPLGKVTEEKT